MSLVAIAAWNQLPEYERARLLQAAGTATPAVAMRFAGWHVPQVENDYQSNGALDARSFDGCRA